MSVDSQRAKELFMALADKVPREAWDDRIRDACRGTRSSNSGFEPCCKPTRNPNRFWICHHWQPTQEEGARSIVEGPGSQISPYQILDLLGEGGMGSVSLAQQQEEPVRRAVALKVIKPGMDTRRVIARFEAERQALAVMDHPSIARSSTRDHGGGRPYFVMELVEGVPITTFCDQSADGAEQRLQLFVRVWQAVQHAHQKGIIHRDLKPSNVLVTRGRRRARSEGDRFRHGQGHQPALTEKTLFTEHGQWSGHPRT